MDMTHAWTYPAVDNHEPCSSMAHRLHETKPPSPTPSPSRNLHRTSNDKLYVTHTSRILHTQVPSYLTYPSIPSRAAFMSFPSSFPTQLSPTILSHPILISSAPSSAQDQVRPQRFSTRRCIPRMRARSSTVEARYDCIPMINIQVRCLRWAIHPMEGESKRE